MKKRAFLLILAVFVTIQLFGCSQKLTEQGVQQRIQQTQALIDRLEGSDYAGVYAQFNSSMQQALPEGTLAAQWKSVHDQYGAYRQHVSETTEQAQGYLRVVSVERYEYAALSISVVFDSGGKIAGLFLSEAHDIDDGKPLPSGLLEEGATVATGEYKLAGKLTLPGNAGPYPAVVIVQGSGPMDMDGSVMNLKPYRDLAWGLAQQGIAVLRYDKRTLTYGQSLASDQNLTVNDETVDDAVSAVNLLKADKRIDPARIYVVGHSLGGMMLPRIQQKANATGLIFMSAPARSLIDLYLEQMTYLTNLSVQNGETTQTQADATMVQVNATVQNVKGLTGDSKLSSDDLMGAPKAYWLDLKGYDQVTAAQQLTVPMLFLQGDRDYQVTMTDFGLWQQAMKGKANVTFKSFKLLGHMYTPGDEKPSPKDYKTAYVPLDQLAVDAIAAFIKK